MTNGIRRFCKMNLRWLFLTGLLYISVFSQEISDVEILPGSKLESEPLLPAEDVPINPETPIDENIDKVPSAETPQNVNNTKVEEKDPEVKPEVNPEVKPEVTPEVKPEVAPEVKPEDKPVVKTESHNKKGRSGKYVAVNPYNNENYDPMTSHVAPPDSDQRGGTVAYAITEQRLKDIRQHFMYPYYSEGGNSDNEGDYQKSVQQSTPQVYKNLNFQLPFFGFRYNYTRVSLNGYLEFSDPPPNYEYPLVFPIKEWPKRNDPAFIGIFFSKCKIGNLRDEDDDRRDPGVYFRMERDLRDRRDRLGVEIRERLKWDIREGIIGSETFDPKHAIIVTWKNVSFNGGWSNAVYQTNTFQLVLATDEVFTYAMFNYLNLAWTSHTEAGGSTDKGEGGTSAFVGFNAGNGTRSYQYSPYSQASVIRDLTSTGWGNGKPGRHYFRIDENILLGNGNKDIDGANLPLIIAPESGNMLGGTVVNITGPRFLSTDRVKCVFDVGNEVYGIVVDYSRAICVQPPLYYEGYIDLQISINSGPYKWKAKYYVENPGTAAQKIFFKDKKVFEKSPSEIQISWEKYNLTRNENANIKISLWGYREVTIKPQFLYITDLAVNVQNTGDFTIIPSQYRNKDNQYLQDLTFGFIQMNLTESIAVNSSQGIPHDIIPTIWSRPIPLAWYFGPQWERKYGTNWPDALCNEWLKDDRFLKNFAHELPQCPCTLEQALADKGRFLPDLDCDKDTSRECPFNDKAEHCVKTGSPSLEGAEQQCCYDKNHYLMMSYDQQWGSSPRRCHNLGYLPWNEATKVPTLSQWKHDVIPKYMCCLWQEEQAVGCETLRFERRPTQDCVAYQAPGIAGVFGDPHIITFDDVAYTFNGKGEFVLLKTVSKTNKLEVQGRFEQMPINQYGEVRATQLSSIVARGNSSTIIEVMVRPKEARWRYRLEVLANGKRIYFDRPALKFQHFPGVTVYTPTYIYNQSEVVVMFDTGAGVEVVENDGYMSARVYLPWSFINKTTGLFGNWSFDQLDEFSTPDGLRVSKPAGEGDTQRFYNDFGLKWMLDDSDNPNVGRALFHREFGRTSSNYNNRTFLPMFLEAPASIIPQNRSIQITQAFEVCVDTMERECLYDYAMTLNKDVAHFTKNYKATILKLKEVSRQKTLSCGVLETPRFGRKNTYLFTPGTKVTYECNTDYILVGDARRTCMPDGHWDTPDYGYTQCLRQQEYSQRQAGLAAGIVMAVLIPLILIFVFFAYKFIQNKKQEQEEEAKETTNLQRQAYQAKALAANEFTDDEDDSTVTSKQETTVY